MERTNVRMIAEELIDRIEELPLEAQLGILRTVAPAVLSQLDEEQIEGFLRDLRVELGEIGRGERGYDLRPGLSHEHPHHH